MNNLEIERKFLVHKKGEPYKKMAFSSHRICQGYIHAEKNASVRIRLLDDKGFITIKGPSSNSGLSRYEFEKEITFDEGQALLKLCEKGRIEKTRYLVLYKGHTFEVDEFYGDNLGLVLAEVELKSEDERFEKPDFLGDEVTGDKRFYNSHLLKNPYSAWRDTLKEEYR